MGMVQTRWTFESGLDIPVTFEVVEDCIQDIVLGDEIIYEHDVYVTQADSIATSLIADASFSLAPFSFVDKWQKSWQRKLQKLNCNLEGTGKSLRNDLFRSACLTHDERRYTRRARVSRNSEARTEAGTAPPRCLELPLRL